MTVTAVLGFVIFLFVAAIFAGVGLAVVNTSRGRKAQPGVIVAVVGVVGTLILGPLNAGLVLVQPDQVGVVFRQTGRGEASLREPLQAGLNWVVPFIDQVELYSTAQRSVTMADSEGDNRVAGAITARSSDGQEVLIDVTVIFRVNPIEINRIHRDWRQSFPQAFIVPQTRSEVRDAVSNFGAEDIYAGGRAALEADIFDQLNTKLQAEGFILSDILVRNLTFSPEFTNAIEQRQIAEQEAQRAVFLVQQAEQTAEQARVEAQGEADAVVINAQGEADAIVIRAEAEAEGLALINSILEDNPNLIQWQYINELGENVNLIIIPSNSPFLFDLQQLLEASGGETIPVPTPSPTPQPTPPPSDDGGEDSGEGNP
ncbi:MAG: hypothetical protein GYB68_15040 [Chloroflexi bacterium]|nr:hypothetical protein [Chloroflexota bacterium]